MAVSLLPSYALGVLGPFLTADLGLSSTAFGALTTVMFVVAAACSPISGPLVDRLGGRTLLLVLFAVGAAVALVAGLAPGYGVLLTAVALAGVSVSLGNPVTNALVARHVDPARQGVVVGVKQSGVQVGAFLAGATLPVLAERLGWRAALLASGLLAVVGLVAAVVSVPAQAVPAAASGRRGPVGPLPPAVAWLGGYALLMGVGVGAVGAYLPLYAVNELGFPAARAGLAAALMGLVGIVARIVWGRQADRSHLPVPVALTWLAAGATAATLLVWGADAVGGWAVWAGALLLGATAIAWNAVGMLAVVREAPAAGSGRASGRVLLGFYLGFVASPVTIGWLIDRTGSYGPGWAVVAATFLVAGVLAGAWRRRVSRPPATTRPSPPGS